jgi:small subunit ribosomal protein S20
VCSSFCGYQFGPKEALLSGEALHTGQTGGGQAAGHQTAPATGGRTGKVLDPVANIKSQIKRIGTNEKRRLRNKAAKSEVKTRMKSAVYAATAGHEDAAEDLRLAVKRLDKAAARGIIHRNQAANRKSALMRQVAELAAASGAGSTASQ